jgi:hypothetical protein
MKGESLSKLQTFFDQMLDRQIVTSARSTDFATPAIVLACARYVSGALLGIRQPKTGAVLAPGHCPPFDSL